jgi:hypothetical protein
MGNYESYQKDIEEFILKDGLDDELQRRVLLAFQRGYPVANLESLLRHTSDSIVMSAGWILGELGTRGTELLALCEKLLDHHLHQIRADAISNILANSDRCPPAIVWSVISRYPKETEYIKTEIVNFLARAPLQALTEAISLTSDISVRSHSIGLSLHTGAVERGRVQEALRSDDPLVRAYALAAARRMELFVRSLWRIAARSSDPVLEANGFRWMRRSC